MRENLLLRTNCFDIHYSLLHTAAQSSVSQTKSCWRWIGVISMVIIGNYIDVCSLEFLNRKLYFCFLTIISD